MPRGPRGEKCPADVIGAAIMLVRIVTGESKTRAAPCGILCRVDLASHGPHEYRSG
jgi:hypothetical protein